MLIGKTKCQIFNYIKERIRRKLGGWKEGMLSQTGRDVLIKSVILAMPTYTMQCFRLPRQICKEINSEIAGFF